MANLPDTELSFLTAALDAQQLFIQKCKAYATQTTDPTVRGLCEQIAAAHQTQYASLFHYVS